MNATLREMIAKIPSAEKMTMATWTPKKCEPNANDGESQHPTSGNNEK